MRAILLAAGYGTRLRPLTDATPKSLLPIAGRPLLVWNLLLLRRHGITEAIINLHHLGDQIVEALGDGSRYGMRLAYSHEPTPLGTGGGLRQAAPYLKGGPFLVVNADTLSECDLTALVACHGDSGALATLAVRADADAEAWGAVMLDGASRIRQIKGEPPVAAAGFRSYMFAGIQVLDPSLLDIIPPGPGSIIDVHTKLLQQGRLLQGYEMTGYWSDIGTPERYAQAQQDMAVGRAALSQSP